MRLELRDFPAGGCDRRVEATRSGGEAAGLGHSQPNRHGFPAIHRRSFPRRGTMDSVFALYSHLWKEPKSRPARLRAEFNEVASVAANLKETTMSKARSYLITAAALLALSGTALAEAMPDGATRNIVIRHSAFADGLCSPSLHVIR